MTGEPKFVELPCMFEQWDIILALLEDLKNQSQEPNCDLKELAKQHQQIVNISSGRQDIEQVDYGNTVLYGLTKYLKKYASVEERRLFLQSTFPAIINLAVQLQHVLPSERLKCSQQQEVSTTVLSRKFVASILACAFLCLFGESRKPWIVGSKLNVSNFTNFFKQLPMPSQNAKIRCILDYFEQVSERWRDLHGNITFIRQVIKREEMPTLDTWLNCDAELCPLTVHEEGLIEDAGCDAVEVDFANKYIGGGALGRGRVQEEIRFTVCPELLTSLIFMECMEENEAIIIKGYEQFSDTEGYAASLQYAGQHTDQAKVDDNGDLASTLLAIDAVSYRSRPERQYTDNMCLRDINKAYVGFSARCLREDTPPRTDQSAADRSPSDDCSMISLTEEEYLTASDDEFTKIDPVTRAIRNLAEGLLVDAMSSALLEASSILLKKEPLVPTDKVRVETCASEVGRASGGQGHADDGMDHLDVADWVMKNRRRSSNLSDVGSRRSSTSTKYSSEFSSEFEEYFENFQKRDQPVIHKTIKEEIYPDVSEFAMSLAAKLLQEGTVTAAHMNPHIQNFHCEAPDQVKLKPKARKSSQEDDASDTCDSQSDSGCSSYCAADTPKKMDNVKGNVKCDISEKVANKFAEIFVRDLMPFPLTCNSNKQSCDEADSDKSDYEPQARHLSSDTSELEASVSDSRLGESSSSENMPGYWFLKKSSEESSDVSESCKADVKPFSSSVKEEASKPPVTRKMKQVATYFVAEVVIGAIQKYSQEVEHENYIPENVLRLQNREFHHGDFDDEDEEENESLQESVALSDGSPSNRKNSSSSGKSSHPESLHDGLNAGGVKVLTPDFEEDHKAVEGGTNHRSGYDSSGRDIANIPKVTISEGSELLYSDIAERIVQEQFSSVLPTKYNQPEKPVKTKPDVILKKSRSKSRHHNDTDKYSGNNLPLGSSASKIHNSDTSIEEKEPRKVTFFASTLSRDLLTNAFVEVQRNMNGGNVYRRSSEPLKISNHAAESLRERSVNGKNVRDDRFQSLTDEDIGSFAQELTRWGSLEEFRSRLRRRSCGFRDPTLSRFAEQLMKSNCSVPDLYLLASTNMSTSGDSTGSRRSSISMFRDSTLASFEEELLASHNRNCRGAKSKATKKTGRLVRQKSIVKENSLDVPEYSKGKSFDSEASGMSWGSYQSQSSSPSQSFDELSSFADRLSLSVVQESLETLLRGMQEQAIVPGTTCPTIHHKQEHVNQHVGNFANNMANDIVLDALLSLANCYAVSIKDQKRASDATSSLLSDTSKGRTISETESLELGQSSSEEFADALDIPYSCLELYAEQVASSVLQHSVNIFQREMDSVRKKQLGRPVSTGNWGCGAFRGDPTLKAMLQWMAASYAGTPFVIYYTFQHPRLTKLQEAVDCIISKGWQVGHLMQAVRRYCATVQEIQDPDLDLFQLLLNDKAFEDIK